MAPRARTIRAAMVHGTKFRQQIVPAHVILLTTDPAEMEIRAKARGKEYTAEALAKQEGDLLNAYGDGKGVTVLDTRGLTLHQVVTRVAKIIHGVKYHEVKLSERLDQIIIEGQQQLFPEE